MGTTEMAVAVKTRRYLNAFRKARALSPEKAIDIQEHGLRTGLVFQRLLRRRIIKPGTPGKYYLDEYRIMQLKRRQSRVVIFGLLLFILLVLVIFLHNAGRLRFW